MVIKGFRRLIVCGVVFTGSLVAAHCGWLESAHLAQVWMGIVAGFAAPDAVQKWKGE